MKLQISNSIILFILLLTLKLTNLIEWSWWWIFSPFWIPCSICAFCLIMHYVSRKFYDNKHKKI